MWHYLGKSLLRSDKRPSVMGILNVTPDSFSDGGNSFDSQLAFGHASEMLNQGVDIIDIGGESTRPGAISVDVEEEWQRIGPVIAQLRQLSPATLISVDTYKPEIAQRSIAAGVQVINDITGLLPEGSMGRVIAESDAAVVIMHMQGTPATMQNAPTYSNVVEEVLRFFETRLKNAELLGIGRERIALDPGIGFGKTLQHNVLLLQNLRRFSELGCALLIGTSRKRMIGELTGRNIPQRLAGSLASALFAAEHGASILRVHDVAETVDALNVWLALSSAQVEKR
jgi:dihydropteroate synthase